MVIFGAIIIASLTLTSCNSGSIENKYWIEKDESFIPQIIKLSSDTFFTLNDSEIKEQLTYKISDNVIEVKNESTYKDGVLFNILESSSDELILKNEKKLGDFEKLKEGYNWDFREAKKEDMLFGMWVTYEDDGGLAYKLKFLGDYDFEIYDYNEHETIVEGVFELTYNEENGYNLALIPDPREYNGFKIANTHIDFSKDFMSADISFNVEGQNQQDLKMIREW